MSVHKLRGTALLTHLTLAKPLVVRKGEYCWPTQWMPDRIRALETQLTGDTRQVTVAIERSVAGVKDCPATRLCKLLEDSIGLQCSGSRDKPFALLGLFAGPLPRDLAVDYAKSTRDVFTDLSFFLLSRGNFSVLSLACSQGIEKSHAYPSWAVDWGNVSSERSSDQKRRFGVARRLQDRSGEAIFTIKRRRDGIALRGLVLKDPIEETGELHPGDPSRLRMRTASGIRSVATAGTPEGDVVCYFEGSGMTFVLRRQNQRMWRLVGQSRVHSNLVKAQPSDVEDIWIC